MAGIIDAQLDTILKEAMETDSLCQLCKFEYECVAKATCYGSNVSFPPCAESDFKEKCFDADKLEDYLDDMESE